MKKCNKYFLGGFTIPSLSGTQANDAVMGGLNLANSFIPSSGNAKTDAITNGIAGGLETVGSAFGPLGSVVGKAAGMLTKGIGALVGTSDSVNTDTGEYTKGRGIKGRRSRARVQDQWRRVNQGISDYTLSSIVAENAANQYGENDYSLAATGGVIPTTSAYLDDGELVRTPSGQIAEIPEQGKPTDSNFMEVPVGTQVLSDKLKVPGTNKTFAEVGKKYMKKDDNKSGDVYAQNSRMLNNRYNQKKYDELMALQEQVKAKRGIKNSNKYAPGGTVRNVGKANNLNYNTDIYGTDPYWDAWSTINLDNYQQANQLQQDYARLRGNDPLGETISYNKDVADYQNRFNSRFNTINQQIGNLRNSGRIVGRGGTSDTPVDWAGDGYFGWQTDLRHLGRNADPTQLTNINARLQARGLEAYNDPTTGMVLTRPLSRVNNNVKPNGLVVPEADLDPRSITQTSPIPRVTDAPRIRRGRSFNIPDLFSGAANLIGPLANIYDSTPEQAPVHTYTPHYGPNSYDISPIIREANLTNSIARYNNNQAGGAGRGANLAQAIQSQVVRNKAISDAYTTKANIENEYRRQNAGIYNDWARWNVENRHRGDVENAQNRAAARNLRRTGLSQLGTALASMSRDRRLTNRDNVLLNYMRPFFEYGSPRDVLNSLYN